MQFSKYATTTTKTSSPRWVQWPMAIIKSQMVEKVEHDVYSQLSLLKKLQPRQEDHPMGYLSCHNDLHHSTKRGRRWACMRYSSSVNIYLIITILGNSNCGIPTHVLIWNISSSRPYSWSLGWTNTGVDKLLLGTSLFQKFGFYGGKDVDQLLGRKLL